MRRNISLLLLIQLVTLIFSSSAQESPSNISAIESRFPSHKKVWVFIMAGQSNMAGRGTVKAEDTLTHPRIFSINAKNEIVPAREPLHFYEPTMAGLDCGVSFARTLLPYIPDSVSLLIIPAAVGGSAIHQWLGDSLHRGVKLLSNLKEKIDLGKKYGIIKGLLWHQGESDATEKRAAVYKKNLDSLFTVIRNYAGDPNLPLFTGGIAVFGKDTVWKNVVNTSIAAYAKGDKRTFIIQTDDFRDKGDMVHFDAASQRMMGRRMAEAFLQTGAATQPTTTIPFNHKKVQYEGRIGFTDTCVAFYWTGSNVTINVEGAGEVSALLSDTRDNNFFYVVVDGKSDIAIKLRINKDKAWYTLATFTGKTAHRVQLFKITNTDDHITRLYAFKFAKGATVLPPPPKHKRRLEFIGNSITCGHGADVPSDSADSGAPNYFNNYWAYGAITARHFNAQYHCTAKSGIGVMVSWFPQIMPEIFDRTNPGDSASKWNFSQYTPDIVVVNLFQNDSWIVNQPANAQFKARFGNSKPSEEAIVKAYANFIQSIRRRYPTAKIICCLGNMDATKEDSKWPGYIDAAVALLKDQNIVSHFFQYKNTPGHPKRKEQQAMADDLIAFIEKTYWKRQR